MIRGTLYKQMYGVDISASQPCASLTFSLYLVVLWISIPTRNPPEALTIQTTLQGRTRCLSVMRGQANVHACWSRRSLKNENGAEENSTSSSVIRPWSYKGQGRHLGTPSSTAVHGCRAKPRGQSLDFVVRASEFAHDETRFGMILSAMPFFQP